MASSSTRSSRSQRPEFMVRLGLAPPYTAEDVKAAYRDQAKRVHPDHGGSAQEFHALQEAFDRAQKYVSFRGDRRRWIAKQMDGYLGFRELMEQLEELGAEATSSAIDWLEKSFGDFAQLTETITSIRLENSSAADELIRLLVDQKSLLGELTRLELPGCQVSDGAILLLEPFEQLRHLDLSGTPVTSEALWIVDTILGLDSLELKGTRVGWWMRRKVAKVMRQRRETEPVTPFSRD